MTDDDCPCYGNLEETGGRTPSGPICQHEAARRKQESEAVAKQRSRVVQWLRDTSPKGRQRS